MPKSHIWIIALLMTVVIEGCKDRNPPTEAQPLSQTT